MPIMTRQQVRDFDSWAIDRIGVPGVVLMENAGRSCAEFIKEELKDINQPKVTVFCGKGNNGGDGYVTARHLLNAGLNVTVVVCADKNKITGDAKINLDILEKLYEPARTLDLESQNIKAQVDKLAEDADLIVDAVFGTGVAGQVREPYKTLIECINAQECKRFAVDIPSGLDCDTGKPLGVVVRADYTVTFAAVKKGFTNDNASDFTGEIYLASIGAQPESKST